MSLCWSSTLDKASAFDDSLPPHLLSSLGSLGISTEVSSMSALANAANSDSVMDEIDSELMEAFPAPKSPSMASFLPSASTAAVQSADPFAFPFAASATRSQSPSWAYSQRLIQDLGGNDSSIGSDSDSSSTGSIFKRQELKAKVLKQVEFYFGDRNYPTDKFLRKHSKAHPERFIPLQVVSIYKKMKKITNDTALMAEALQGSCVVELNEDKTAIRRRFGPPKYTPESICACIAVVASNRFRATAQDIESSFNHFGQIDRLHTILPGMAFETFPHEVQQVFGSKENLPQLVQQCQQPLYFVEFEYQDLALDAEKYYDAPKDQPLPLFTVKRLYTKKKRSKRSQQSEKQVSSQSQSQSASCATTPAMSMPPPMSRSDSGFQCGFASPRKQVLMSYYQKQQQQYRQSTPRQAAYPPSPQMARGVYKPPMARQHHVQSPSRSVMRGFFVNQ